MLDTRLKIEICKEVLIKSGFDRNKEASESVFSAVMGNRFLFELDNNEVVVFVSWHNPQVVAGRKKVFVNNLWIDPKYRGNGQILKIKKLLRNDFRGTSFIWFNRKKQKLVERI